MVLVGIVAGAILVAAPQVQNFAIKPYFWVLIAVGLFDGGIYLLGRTAPGQMLTMGARLAGFVFRDRDDGGYSNRRRRAGSVFLILRRFNCRVQAPNIVCRSRRPPKRDRSWPRPAAAYWRGGHRTSPTCE